MHVVELRLELQAQLDFFLVVLGVFLKLFFNPFPISALFFQLALGVLQIFFDFLFVFSEKAFVGCLLVKFGVEF